MIILDKPYISNFMQQSLIQMKIPVLKNQAVIDLELNPNLYYLEENEFVAELRKNPEQPLYTVSENSIEWIFNKLAFTSLPEKIRMFKDKFAFRKLMQKYNPNFFFHQISLKEMPEFDISSIKKPFVIKPSKGFFSMAVFVVKSDEEWPNIVSSIQSVIKNNEKVFPTEVLDSQYFIIEEMIEGEEYAVDAYFDKEGNPVIVNILQHMFASDEDTGDRIYFTSVEIIQRMYPLVMQKLQEISEITQITTFPIHIEIRVDSNNHVGIIEVNPLRFAGLCVADLAYFAFGSNSYECFLHQTKPDWESIFKTHSKNTKFAMVLGDFPPDIRISEIKSIDYNRFSKLFSKPLEIRKIDYHNIPLFAISFIEIDESHEKELEDLLKMEFREYINF